MPKNLSGDVKTSRAPTSARQSWGAWLSRYGYWAAGFGVFLIVLGVYSPSLGFQFILDDHRFTADPRIQNSGHVWDYFTTFAWAQFTGAAPSFYRPVFLLWMRLNYLINGQSPWGWHLLSIVKHALVAALLSTLAWKLLRDLWSGILAALLFAFHPAQTESVSWVTVPDPLMTAGLLLALMWYVRYWRGPSAAGVTNSARRAKKTLDGRYPERRLGSLVLSALACLAALFAKETAIVFPAVILGLGMVAPELGSAAKGKREKSLAGRLPKALYHSVPFACVTVVYLLLRLSALDGKLSPATQHLPWKTVMLSWPAILWFYIKVMLWPLRSYAFADPIAVDTFSARAVLLPLWLVLCFAAVVGGAVIWIRRAAALLLEDQTRDVDFALITGVLLLFLPLLPALNLNALNPGDYLHGRYTYLPLAGLALIIGIVCRFAGRLKGPVLAIAGLIIVVYVPVTLAQQKQWKDDLTVFTVAHELAPDNAPVAKNLADARVRDALQLEEDGRCAEAIPIFQQVSREYPDDWYPLAGMGYCYAENDDFVRAEEFLGRAANLSHDSQITQQWQELRAHIGLPPAEPASK
jgi:protein O-mannosyl-transferase